MLQYRVALNDIARKAVEYLRGTVVFLIGTATLPRVGAAAWVCSWCLPYSLRPKLKKRGPLAGNVKLASEKKVRFMGNGGINLQK